jgi:hypothetical protein
MRNSVPANHPSTTPDEEQLAELLSRFKPVPTDQFYARMNNAPWIKSTPTKNKVSLTINSRRLAWGLVIVLVLCLVMGVLFIPSVRVIARQIIYSFIAAPTNQIEVQVTVTNPSDLYQYTNPSNYPLSVEKAQNTAGYPVMQLSTLPKDVHLIGARFDPGYDATIILYQGDGYDLFLTQRPLGNGQDVFSIGSEVKIEQVKIGENSAEFVAGGWKAISTQTPNGTMTPGGEVSIRAVWDNTLPQYTLRWQVNGFAYELRSVGENSPSQTSLINLANELK